MRKTKIVCTLGPTSNTEEIILKMVKAGMNVARFNFSHGEHAEHKRLIDITKNIRKSLDTSLAILLDTKGPEIRVRMFENGSIILQEGQEFILTTEELLGNQEITSITYANLPKEVYIGCRILIDDGKIELIVEKTDEKNIYCRVRIGGKVSNRKGVNVPNVHLSMAYLSEADKKDLLFGIEQDVDFVAASFVRSKADVELLREFLDYHGGYAIRIISKIENQEGIDNFDEILRASDGIMVARGDMGVEVDYERLPGIQKRCIAKCYQSGKMVITATQMLESMISSNTPTRAEISDVANAIFDGTSAIMLSGESANGKYPVLAVETMAKIAEGAERDAFEMNKYKNMMQEINYLDVTNAICDAACTTARDIKAKAIIAVTESGRTARQMSKFRPQEPIIASTPREKTYHQLALSWGVYPIISKMQKTTDELFRHAANCAKKTKLVSDDDLVVIAAGVPLGISGSTNIVKVQYVKEQKTI